MNELLQEIARYLAAVDVFRAESCEPTWRPELIPDASLLTERLARYEQQSPQPAH